MSSSTALIRSHINRILRSKFSVHLNILIIMIQRHVTQCRVSTLCSPIITLIQCKFRNDHPKPNNHNNNRLDCENVCCRSPVCHIALPLSLALFQPASVLNSPRRSDIHSRPPTCTNMQLRRLRRSTATTSAPNSHSISPTSTVS